jgi:fructose-bisphosphate aldolase, class I
MTFAAACNTLGGDEWVMLKLTIPSEDDFYRPLIDHPKVLRVVTLSGPAATPETRPTRAA